MNDLALIKAFAKLEGLTLHEHTYFELKGGDELSLFSLIEDLPWNSPDIVRDGLCYAEYNPITDLSLSFKGMTKYHVDIYHHMGCVNIDNQKGLPFVSYLENGIPYAIIECILKSKGLWK